MEQQVSASPRIGVVSVSYQSEAEIRELIADLQPLKHPYHLRLAIVSNSGDCESLRCEPTIQVIQSGANIGFGRGCNLGVKHLDTELIVFCNPDVRLSADILQALAKLTVDHPEYGIVAPFSGNDPQRCTPTGKLHDYSERNIGSCFMMRRAVFRQVGGFDENFFLWWEDTDLKDRVLASGLKVGFADGIVVSHSSGHSYKSSTIQQRFFLTNVWISAHAYYLLKHRGKARAVFWLLGMCLTNVIRRIRGTTAPGRDYIVPSEAIRFGWWLILHAGSMRELTSFDGKQVGWQKVLA